MILLIDNYDSFTFNLYQMIGALDPDVEVVRNDTYDVSRLIAMRPSHMVLSPGPGRPKDAGVCLDLVRVLAADAGSPTLPALLGVCLGHQALCEALGAQIVRAPRPWHGKPSTVGLETKSLLFTGLPGRIMAARYHSLVADAATIPPTLRCTAHTDDGLVMAVEHTTLPLFGVQFHPESILTPYGGQILRNFLHAGAMRHVCANAAQHRDRPTAAHDSRLPLDQTDEEALW
ncbi:MAG: aminodeoxychorismate/anthranilate synthase component II [Coriobacteriales bacterium]|jgi:anthranilate synthase component 2|nr:aminodeoxychorismate/anthranilate synthase component II [Coriobacteriales bacterium]